MIIKLLPDLTVQRRATKLIKGLNKLGYEKRLRKLHLPTLKYRWIRGDMIEAYKVISGKYNSSVSIQIPTNEKSFTRGNKYNILANRPTVDRLVNRLAGRDGVLEAMALASRRLEDNWSCPWPWPWGPSPWPWPWKKCTWS